MSAELKTTRSKGKYLISCWERREDLKACWISEVFIALEGNQNQNIKKADWQMIIGILNRDQKFR